MGFIIAGILVAGMVFLLYVHFSNGNSNDDMMVSIIIVLIFITGIVAGITLPTGGFKPLEEVQTVELQALSDKTISIGRGSIIYVSINSSNAYTYYTQVESEFAGENSRAYVSRTISGDNITVVEEENCDNPRLIEYKQYPNSTFWSFGVGAQKKYYVFYVPKGTIAHEIALGQ